MKRLNLLLALFLVGTVLFAQNKPKYSRARINYNTPENFQLLIQNGITIDSGKHKKGTFVESDFSQDEIAKVQSLGINVEILIDNVQEFYVNRNLESNKTSSTSKNSTCNSSGSNNYVNPTHFNHGSMGGFLTYTEMLAELDEMASLYPNIITVKAPVDTFLTHENRPLYWVKISDNPNVDEAEPEMLYDAVHHAREPAAMQQLIYYMWYLLENYTTNTEIQAIVNNTELYFIPIVNPDGYIYNQTTNPTGGGMFRKNRNNNGDGTFGVDLNRNYNYIDPITGSVWGTTGVSFTTSNDTYPGLGAFSEPETQTMKWFCSQHNFKMAINNHTYSDLLLYPFGYQVGKPTPDNTYFESISTVMVEENTLVNELSSLLYPASGDSDDWMYGDTTSHSKIYSFTPEIGSSVQGFWPAEIDIDNICRSMIHLNLTAAHLITNYAKVHDLTPLVVANMNGTFKYNIQRLGLENPANFTVSVIPISSNILSVGAPKNHNSMSLLQTDMDSISYNLAPTISAGDAINYVLAVNNGYFTAYDTLTKIYGQENTLFSDLGNNLTNWVVSQTWGTTTSTYYSASSCITDSPTGNYSNGVNKTIKMANATNLTNAVSATLSFYAKWAIEDNWDYVQVEVSTDNGTTWIPQCGKYTNSGNADQVLNEPLYDGFQTTWVKEEINLSNYLGQNILVRFQIVADGGVTEDGFYFDDFKINVIYGSTGIGELNHNEVYLGECFPNPTNEKTTINYKLPKNSYVSKLMITNSIGQEIYNTIVLPKNNTIEISTIGWAQGVYYYFIESNGERFASKKMIVVK